ncbi:hypothetical protein IFM89_003525 [Coptis chinensis]|uniref:Uncharacterized protein n=1 Tax=Coptis chinensis TaxID=261450 RepID=A0A835GWM8_9MAGN|nr:hypothetical protein IFM89_003525 [Coptis chinensis]
MEEQTTQQHQQHECTLATYNDENMVNWQIKTSHHYLIHRLNQELFRCAIYDSDDPSTERLVGVEHIISERIYNVLPPDERKLWHSHAYDNEMLKEKLWVNLLVVEVLKRTELPDLSRSYGKFWCTSELKSGDALPLGMPSRQPSAMDGMSSEDHLAGEVDAEGRKSN